jgi:hypothetical protein
MLKFLNCSVAHPSVTVSFGSIVPAPIKLRIVVDVLKSVPPGAGDLILQLTGPNVEAGTVVASSDIDIPHLVNNGSCECSKLVRSREGWFLSASQHGARRVQLFRASCKVAMTCTVGWEVVPRYIRISTESRVAPVGGMKVFILKGRNTTNPLGTRELGGFRKQGLPSSKD